jgi:hypothetical protein
MNPDEIGSLIENSEADVDKVKSVKTGCHWFCKILPV